jgi:hypothetical protein
LIAIFKPHFEVRIKLIDLGVVGKYNAAWSFQTHCQTKLRRKTSNFSSLADMQLPPMDMCERLKTWIFMTKSSKPTVENPIVTESGKGAPTPDLELPEWSGGCERQSSLMTIEQMHQHSENLLRSFNRPPREVSPENRCHAEFVL